MLNPTVLLLLSLSNVAYLWFETGVSAPLFAFFLLVQILIWNWIFERRHTLNPVFGFTCLLVCFVIARSVFPVFEDDFYRYFWDGYQVASGNNPYAGAPASFESVEHKSILTQINFPNLVTLYPPVIEVLFGVFYKLSGGQLPFFLFLLTAIGTLFFAFAFFRAARKETNAALMTLLLLQHPLLVREWYQSAHFDVWIAGVLVSVIAFSGFWTRVFIIALGCGMKFITLPALLIFAPKLKKFFKACFICLSLSIVPWLLFVEHFENFFETFKVFSSQWEMNSGFYRLVFNGVAFFRPEFANPVARGLAWGSWGTVTLFMWRKTALKNTEKMFWTFFLLVLMGPVANVWYFTWSLPFVVFLPTERRRLMTFAFAWLPLSYAFFMAQGSFIRFEFLWNVEHLVIWFCVLACTPTWVGKKLVKVFEFASISLQPSTVQKQNG